MTDEARPLDTNALRALYDRWQHTENYGMTADEYQVMTAIPALLARLDAAERERDRLKHEIEFVVALGQPYGLSLQPSWIERLQTVLALGAEAERDRCYCCSQGCQAGCPCYTGSNDEAEDIEYHRKLDIRKAKVGMPIGVGFELSNKYGFHDSKTNLYYPETEQQRQNLIRDGLAIGTALSLGAAAGEGETHDR